MAKNLTKDAASEPERITFQTTRRSSAALAEAIDLVGDNKTDTINRALTLYALLARATKEREKVPPGEIVFYLTDPTDPDETERVVFA